MVASPNVGRFLRLTYLISDATFAVGAAAALLRVTEIAPNIPFVQVNRNLIR